jgi:AAA15 family ATPase/GTPase
LPAFAVFAGANGSGKSNFFDAMEFVSHISRFGLEEAIRQHGGYERMHSFLRADEAARTFSFEMVIELENKGSRFLHSDKDRYSGGYNRFRMLINSWDKDPLLDEKYWMHGDKVVHERIGDVAKLHYGQKEEKLSVSFLQFLVSDLTHALNRIRLFCIDSIDTARWAKLHGNGTELSRNGSDVAEVS